jgi:hypothetical protein
MRNTLYIGTGPSPVTFTWHGAQPNDLGPGGALVRMMIAQLAGHRAAMCDEATEDCWHLLKLGAPGKVIELFCRPAAFESPETACIPTTIACDGSEQQLDFVIRRTPQWKVDMLATIDRAMTNIVEEAAASVAAVATR